jgi:Protein of unknown function (DUF2637)
MNGNNDTLTRLGTAAAVLLVAAIAATVSFVHIAHLALTHGQTPLAAVLLPLSIDGTVAAAALVMLRAARAQIRTPWLARFMLALAVVATLAANIGYGVPYGIAGALLSGWPAVAFIGCAEMAIGMVRRTRTKPGPTEPVQPQAAATAAVTVPTSREIQARQSCSPATAVKIRKEVARAVKASQNGHQ